jgi:hypothetical protein
MTVLAAVATQNASVAFDHLDVLKPQVLVVHLLGFGILLDDLAWLLRLLARGWDGHGRVRVGGALSDWVASIIDDSLSDQLLIFGLEVPHLGGLLGMGADQISSGTGIKLGSLDHGVQR